MTVSDDCESEGDGDINYGESDINLGEGDINYGEGDVIHRLHLRDTLNFDLSIDSESSPTIHQKGHIKSRPKSAKELPEALKPKTSLNEIDSSSPESDGAFNKLKIELDAVSMLLFVTALSTRFYKLAQPRAVVFDELNFGKFAAHYINRVFHFDVHPPLGKMLVAMSGQFGGFDGQFDFDKIGAELPPSLPLFHLRAVPAFCGSLLVPLTYHLLLEIGCSSWTATFGALLIILDNALLVQSHFIFLEPILLCFVSLAFIFLFKYLKTSYSASQPPTGVNTPASTTMSHSGAPFLPRLPSLFLVGMFIGFAVSVKYSAVYAWLMCVVAVFADFWQKHISDLTVGLRTLIFRAAIVAALVVSLPVVIYFAILSLHVIWLEKAGPNDHVMTSAFQASLEGGLASIIKGQPPFVKVGSQITLRHSFGQPPCWLHSHQYVYPVKYPDERGSSHQQQVTCYGFKDINNWWIVKDPDMESLPSDSEALRPLQHGDVIQLLHGMTGRALNSHDVAAPLTPENQEVTCYIDYNVSMAAQNLWRIEVTGAETGSDLRWRTIASHVRLIHVDTGQALKATGQILPEWGFHQMEVATDRFINQNPTIWNVEEHRITKALLDNGDKTSEKKRKRDLIQSDFLPDKGKLSLLQKMIELQIKMITTIHDIPKEHRYGSSPSEWPLVDTTVGYWVSSCDHAQIHLVGNPLIWKAAFVAVWVYLVLLVLYSLLIRRGWILADHCAEPADSWWPPFVRNGWFLVGGYLLHFVPYFVYDYTLFLHHYIPALYFKILSLAFLAEHISFLLRRVRLMQDLVTLVVLCWVVAVVVTFKTLAPLSYGDSDCKMAASDLKALQLNENWDFIYH